MVQQKIIIAIMVLIFHLGFIIFEYGQSRVKNAETSIKKHIFLLMTAALLTFGLAFGLAFGEPHLAGWKYYCTYKMFRDPTLTSGNPTPESLVLNFLIQIFSMAAVAGIATSALNERQSVIYQVGVGCWLQLFLIPLVTAWT